MNLNYDLIRPIFGGSMKQSQVDGINVITEAFGRYGDGDRRKLAYLLATAKHETAHTMQPIHERGKVAYFNKYEPGTAIGKRLGNTLKGDGYKFRGRGYVQCTGRANYAKAGKKIGVDLLANPDAALEPAAAARILITGCLEGWFTGKKLGDYITANTSDFVNARRVVNGTDRAALIAGYAAQFLPAIGEPVQPPAPFPPTPFEQPPAPAPVDPIPQPKEPTMNTPDVKVVDVKSAWLSKINWTQFLGLAAMLATMFGIPVTDELKAQLIAGITGLTYVVTWALRTFFSNTITPASANKL
jgi:putative chitinase